MSSDNIILVGFMATGKSHVARIISRATGRQAADLDEEIVRRAAKPIHQIFSDDGEAVFRAMERHAAFSLCEGEDKIIAAGGGAFAQESTRKVLLENGTVFCLTASPETIYYRISRGSISAAVRPMLAGSDPLERIRQLLLERAAAYDLAHHSIPTDDRTPEQVADEILQIYQTETPQTETPQTESPQTETPQTESPQTETPQTESPQTETPQTESPQTETPQTESPQTETPQTESPQTESRTPPDAGRPTQLTIQENLDGSN